MSDLIRSLLAADGMAQRAGIALKPELRAALEAELRVPAKSSGPLGSGDYGDDDRIIPFPTPNCTMRRSG